MRKWIVVAILWLLPATAHARFDICNETESWYYEVQAGYYDPSVSDWRSRGTYVLYPGECALVSEEAEGDYFYFQGLYTLNVEQAVQEGEDWEQALGVMIGLAAFDFIEGDVAMCVDSGPFDIVGDRRCVSRGYDFGYFVEVEGRRGSCLIELLPEGRFIGC